MINEQNEHTWCTNAKNTLSIDTDGKVKVCCMIDKQILDENSEAYNARKTKLPVIFNSTNLQNLRKNLNDGIRDPLCKKCWEQEDAGIKSKRLRDNEYLKFNSDKIKFLELYLSNTCNLSCRTCGPWCSSQWIKEYHDTKLQDNEKISLTEFSKLYNNKFVDTEQEDFFWNNLYEICSDLEHIDFYGGEPFLIKKHWDLVKYCVEQKYSIHQSLHYTTNVTVWPEEHIEYLKKFKYLRVNFSIDAINEQSNYVRYPTKWAEVEDNLNKWYETFLYNSSVIYTICTTVSPLTIFYLDRVISFIENLNAKFKSDRMKHVFLNVVHKPSYYNIKFIPDYIKREVTDKLTPLIIKNSYLEGVLKFMNDGVYNENEWKNFIHNTKIGDRYRNQQFKDYFPEIHHLMQINGDEI